MPENARVVEIPYHVTQRGADRQPVFFTAADRKFYFQLTRESLDDAGGRVLAYCLVTNPVHRSLAAAGDLRSEGFRQRFRLEREQVPDRKLTAILRLSATAQLTA